MKTRTFTIRGINDPLVREIKKALKAFGLKVEIKETYTDNLDDAEVKFIISK